MMTERRLILAGGGHAHLLVLQALARDRLPCVEVVLISPSRWQHYSGMLPGWMAGHYTLEDCRIDLVPLAERARVTFIEDHLIGMDAGARRVSLGNGTHLHYDLLSLDVGSEVDTAGLTALGARLLPVKPLAAFSDAWPVVAARARTPSGCRLAVVGGGAAGIETALAAAEIWRQAAATSPIRLITGAQGVLPGHGAAVRRRVEAALQRAGVRVECRRATGTTTGLVLDHGQALQVDVVFAATGARAPAWLQASGLQRDARGFVAVNAHHQSTSHPEVFAAGDVCARVDRAMARSGVHAVRAGPVLAHNLQAWLNGHALQTYEPRRWSLYLLSTGRHEAIASWGPFSACGAWVWRLKDRIDRRFMARFSPGPP